MINIYFKQPKGAWLYAMHLLCYMRLDLIFAIAKQYRYKSATKQYRYKSATKQYRYKSATKQYRYKSR